MFSITIGKNELAVSVFVKSELYHSEFVYHLSYNQRSHCKLPDHTLNNPVGNLSHSLDICMISNSVFHSNQPDNLPSHRKLITNLCPNIKQTILNFHVQIVIGKAKLFNVTIQFCNCFSPLCRFKTYH